RGLLQVHREAPHRGRGAEAARGLAVGGRRSPLAPHQKRACSPRYKGLAEERTSAISYPREGSMPTTMEAVVLLVAATLGFATGMFILLLITAWDFFKKPIKQFFQKAWNLVFCTAIVMMLFSGTAKAEEQDYVDVDGKQHYVVPITVEAPALTASDRLR